MRGELLTIAPPNPCSLCGTLVESPRYEEQLCATCDEEMTQGQAEADLHTAVAVMGIGKVLSVLRDICRANSGFAGTKRDRTYRAIADDLRAAMRLTEGE